MAPLQSDSIRQYAKIFQGDNRIALKDGCWDVSASPEQLEPVPQQEVQILDTIGNFAFNVVNNMSTFFYVYLYFERFDLQHWWERITKWPARPVGE